MFERFKTYEQLRWEDLGFIEAPFYARHLLSRFNSHYGHRSDELRDIYRALIFPEQMSSYLDDSHIRETLQRELDDGRVFCLNHKPVMPLLRWQEDKELPRGGRWEFKNHKDARLGLLHHFINSTITRDRLIRTSAQPQQSPKPTRILSHAGMTPVERSASTASTKEKIKIAEFFFS